MKKQLSILVVLLLISTIPAAAQGNLVMDQGNFAAALITDITIKDSEEIFIQYLGNVNVRLHWAFFDDTCLERTDFVEEVVTPLDIVDITLTIPDQQDRKLVVVVEDLAGANLINQPILGIKYINGRSSVKNLAGMTIPNTNIPIGGSIAPIPPGSFNVNFNGGEYGLFPQNLIYLPLLTSVAFSTPFFPEIAINIFTPQPTIIPTRTLDDNEEFASNSLDNIDCAGLTNLDIPGYRYTDIGGGANGINLGQGLLPGSPTTDVGVGVLRTTRQNGAIFGEGTVTNFGTISDAISNLFFIGTGSPISLMVSTLAAPQGIFTGQNENYQNPAPASALASLGVQKAVLGESPDAGHNLETIFAIHNLGADRTVKARWDFIVLDPQQETRECLHQDFSLELSEEDVEYVRVSHLTGLHLLPGEPPIIGVLTIWDPDGDEAKNLLGYRWDVVMENTPECSDGIDNDGDGDIDFPPGDQQCVDADDDSESSGEDDPQQDVLDSVTAMEAMLSLHATISNNNAQFESAEHFTTIVPALSIDDTGDYNLIVVNWDAIDDPSATDQTLDFQVTDMEENVRSIRVPAECITLLDKQSFPGLADGNDFGTNPDVISLTGRFDEQNRGLATFLYYNDNGIFPTEIMGAVQDLAFTNTHHDGEIFTDINIMPGSVPGPGGTFGIEVGVTTSVPLSSETVTATWYATVPSGNSKVKGPQNCQGSESITAAAGEAFAIIVSGCSPDPLTIDSILRVESTTLGVAEIFVPAGS